MIASALGRVLPADRLSRFCWSRGSRLNLGAGSPACQAVRSDKRPLFANSGRLHSDAGSATYPWGPATYPWGPASRLRFASARRAVARSAEAAAGLAAIRHPPEGGRHDRFFTRRSCGLFLDAALLAELDDADGFDDAVGRWD